MNNDIHQTAIIEKNVTLGKNVKVWHFVHIREKVKIGNNCIFGKNVYIDSEVIIGNNCKIQNNVSIFHGATIQDGVFIGPHVCFSNDKYPRAIDSKGKIKSVLDWKVSKTFVKNGASIGANCTILPGVTIGEFAMIGAGSVITKNVPAYTLVYGNPGKIHGKVNKDGSIVKTKP